MTRSPVLPLIAAVLVLGPALVAGPAPAQTLRERIAAVRAKHAEAANAAARKSSPTALLQKLVYRRVRADFRETPVRAVFEYLHTALDLNLVVRYDDDPSGYGIDPDTPITLVGDDLLALDLLEMVVDQCSQGGIGDACTWQLGRGFVEVGPKERLAASSAQVLKIYPIDELLFEAPKFTGAPKLDLDERYRHYGAYGGYRGYGGGRPYGGSGVTGGTINPRAPATSPNTDDEKQRRAEEIVELIVQAVEPEAWRRVGGTWASIDYRAGALVVRAPDFIHRQIGGYPPVPKPRAK